MFAVRVFLGFVAAALLCGTAMADEKKDENKGGTVAGLVTAKDKNWIEVKADGEEKARRYVPRWLGGNPNQGGGPDKKILEAIAAVKVGSRVRLEWEFEERARVVKLDVLKAPEKDEKEKK